MKVRGVQFVTEGNKGIPAPGSIGVTRTLSAGSTELDFDPATATLYATVDGETFAYVGVPMVLSGLERGPSVAKAGK